jgi:hypothetical protein
MYVFACIYLYMYMHLLSRSHGGDHFSAAGIQIAIDFFNNYKVDIVAFIPSSYLRKKPRDGAKGNSCMETDDWEVLNTLVHTGIYTNVYIYIYIYICIYE